MLAYPIKRGIDLLSAFYYRKEIEKEKFEYFKSDNKIETWKDFEMILSKFSAEENSKLESSETLNPLDIEWGDSLSETIKKIEKNHKIYVFKNKTGIPDHTLVFHKAKTIAYKITYQLHFYKKDLLYVHAKVHEINDDLITPEDVLTVISKKYDFSKISGIDKNQKWLIEGKNDTLLFIENNYISIYLNFINKAVLQSKTLLTEFNKTKKIRNKSSVLANLYNYF